MFNRDILKNLSRWKGKKDRKPLILRGARQVGKQPPSPFFQSSSSKRKGVASMLDPCWKEKGSRLCLTLVEKATRKVLKYKIYKTLCLTVRLSLLLRYMTTSSYLTNWDVSYNITIGCVSPIQESGYGQRQKFYQWLFMLNVMLQ